MLQWEISNSDCSAVLYTDTHYMTPLQYYTFILLFYYLLAHNKRIFQISLKVTTVLISLFNAYKILIYAVTEKFILEMRCILFTVRGASLLDKLKDVTERYIVTVSKKPEQFSLS